MPNTSIKEALAEAYASCRSDQVILETLSFVHPVAGTKRIVKDRQDWTLGLETGGTALFTGCGFDFTLPATGTGGLQALSIAVDNVDRSIGDYVELAKDSLDPVVVTYRPYLSTDLTQPQLDPPLELYLTDVVTTVTRVTGKATFLDIMNMSFPRLRFTRSRFRSLANL